MRVHLTSAELLTFCGLVRLLVRLDGQITAEEREAIEQLGPELAVTPASVESPYRESPTAADDGVDRFWDTMDRAASEFADREAVRRAALGVTRQEARQEIYAALYELAACDTISSPEWGMLEWLSSEWGVRC